MTAMRVRILVSRPGFRRWHSKLRDTIAGVAGVANVRFRFDDRVKGDSWPASVRQLLALERLLLRRSRPGALDAARPDERLVSREDDAVDLVVDLTGREVPARRTDGARLLRPLFDGQPSETAAIAALLAGVAPTLALEDAASGAILATGLPSLETADSLTTAMEAVLSRVVALIGRALTSPPGRLAPPARSARKSPSASAFLLCNLARQCAREIYHLCCHSPHWRIGWRHVQGPGVAESGSLGGAPWRVMQDCELGFAADPFPIERNGRTFVFYERLDYRTDKGVIFAREFDANGPAGEPFPVIEEPWHLSYPHLIEDGDELYMLPEASLSGAISLYRCVEFPRRWERVSELVSGVEAADATIFRHNGRFWMTSVVRDGWGGYSDTLVIHHAGALLGPWEEHASRPVLIDSRFARPAGAVVNCDGALYRPVQDCSAGYGMRLAIMRIDALDAESFAQTRVGLISPGRFWPGRRLHTINRCGRLECIDGVILAPKNETLRRWTHTFIDNRALSDRADPAQSDAAAARA